MLTLDCCPLLGILLVAWLAVLSPWGLDILIVWVWLLMLTACCLVLSLDWVEEEAPVGFVVTTKLAVSTGLTLLLPLTAWHMLL